MDERIVVRIDSNTSMKLDEFARHYRIPKSRVVRAVISHYLSDKFDEEGYLKNKNYNDSCYDSKQLKLFE